MSMTGQICSHTTAACSPSRSLQKSACTTHRPAFTPPRHHLQQSHKLSRCSAQPTAEVRDRLAETGAVVSDQSVPEGHKGLHGFLYGEGGAEAHDSDARYNFREGQDDGTCSMAVLDYLRDREGERPLGVYALYNAHNDVQYVGYSRNMVLAVKNHLQRVGEDKCAFVRAMVFANAAMASRANLEREMHSWIEKEGVVPPGNGPEQELWEGQTALKAMSAAEMAEYEEKKLKMRKAMGENLHDDVQGEAPDSKQRRLNMIKAVEGDDWSAVIDSQTQQTIEDAVSTDAATSDSDTLARKAHSEQDEALRQANRAKSQQQQLATASGGSRQEDEQSKGAQNPPVVSPFTRATVHRQIGSYDFDEEEDYPPLTIPFVDRALDEVRPYLIADGGNVEVVDVEDGIVKLRLQGACGTCASSTATMKMGIERSLMATFGEQLQAVQQVDQIDTSASVDSVNSHLDMLRPAIKSYGGTVDVVAVGKGICEVKYEGPAPIGMGIQAAIKDKFPDLKEVKLL